MSDRIYMALAFVGFIILAVVYSLNYDGSQDQKVFSEGSFYTPHVVKSKVDSSIELYSQMSSSRAHTCPQTTISHTDNRTFNLDSIRATNSSNDYGAHTIFVCPNDVSASSSAFGQDASVANIISVLNLKCSEDVLKQSTKKGVLISEYWNIANDNYELIAPFKFDFGNINSTNPEKIVIVSANGKCRITFKKVANWFCAGPVGTVYKTGVGTSNSIVPWENHGRAVMESSAESDEDVNSNTRESITGAHATIIGNTGNATITGGMAGDVIGYGNSNTKVVIEKYAGSWKAISLFELLTDPIPDAN